jgi:hypothetical protein
MIKSDIYLKGIIQEFFPDLLRFFYSNADEIFDLKQKCIPMDKEMPEIMPDSETKKGTRVMDVLMKVFRRDGKESCILIHIEIQDRVRPEFARRMLIYWYRCLDRFKLPVTAIAILTGSKPKARQGIYVIDEGLGTRNTYEYKSYHILDHSEAELLAMKNPFALVVLAAQKELAARRKKATDKKKNKRVGTQERRIDIQIQNEQLNEQRLAIARIFVSLARDQYSHEQIVNFLGFLSSFIYIANREINSNFRNQIDLITGKSNTMGIFEIVAAEAMEKGIKKERRRSRIEIEKSRAEAEKSKVEAEKKSKTEFVKNLLMGTKFTVAKIASLVSVPEDFVEKVKKTLN